jgi:hypothetical protein
MEGETMTVLKPCPFCGGNVSIVDKEMFSYIECPFCLGRFYQVEACSVEDNIEAWNKRSGDDYKMNDLKQFAKERDEAFTAFVMNDDWDACLKHFKKWGHPDSTLPTIVKQAGVYKAVQECEYIPLEVKAEAAKKCVLLGFKPTMR